MEEVETDSNQNLLFKIDNTMYEIQSQIIFATSMISMAIIAFFSVANKNIQNRTVDTYFEFYTSQLYNGRFLGANIMFIIAGFALFIGYKKSKKKNNNIYFYDTGLIYRDVLIKKENIKKIKTFGCCVLPKDNMIAYIFAYTIGLFMVLPYMLLELIIVNIAKIINKKNINFFSYKFAIEHSVSENVMLGYYYDEETKMKLINYKEQILKGEK